MLCAGAGVGYAVRTPNESATPSTVVAESVDQQSSNTVALPPTGDCVQDTWAGLRPRQRIGQLLLLGVPAVGLGRNEATISRSAPGGVFLTGRSTAGRAATSGVSDSVQGLGRKAARGVGMFVGVDQEGGRVQVLRGPGFSDMPTATEQGTWGAAKLENEAAKWGKELKDAKVNVNLAPVADVLSRELGRANAPLGKFDRAYGSTPEAVATHVAAFVRGMQSQGVATTVKHFPGLGRVRDNTDFSAEVTDVSTSGADENLKPFNSGVKANAAWIMISSAVYLKIDPDNPGAFSRSVVQLARERPGFTGLVVSDDLGNAAQVKAIAPGDRAVRFVGAGGDVILTGNPKNLEPMIDALQTAAGNREFADRLEAAQRRVLQAKMKMGLLPCPPR